ncbi:MAG: hypothetical protein EBR49_12150, partial [Betaproteobacteria bacterium]|nr:hypothetical protein [Betaproteobacteria bacterium]
MATQSPYLAPSLKDKGYIGVTGSTPYRPPTPQETATLQHIYQDTSVTTVPKTVAPGAIALNVNFDGTHNNGTFPAKGEFATNIYQLNGLQERAPGANPSNTIYMPGVGAQTVPTGTILPNGNPALESSPSTLAALPFNAGNVAQGILESAFDQLSNRVRAILAENPNAEIAINLSGFSRGGAEATAFANMLNERGIGPFKPGTVRIANLLLLDPVDKTDGVLNTKPPPNVDNTLVMVATGETRSIMPAMPVGDDARIITVPVAHSGLGGSYNPQGTAAVVLAKAREFMEAGGSPVAEIPENLQPDWEQMFIHNSAVGTNGLPKLGGSETWDTDALNRRYEGSGKNAPSVQETLERQPVYSSIPVDDNGTAAYTATYPDGKVVTKLTENGKLAEVQIAMPQGAGTLTTHYDAQGHVKSTVSRTSDDEGNTLLVTTLPDGTYTTRLLENTPTSEQLPNGISSIYDQLVDAFSHSTTNPNTSQ